MDFPLRTLVEVTWRDACTKNGWKDIDDYREHRPVMCRTAGYLLVRNREVTVIAFTQSEGGTNADLNQSIAIPTSWILKLKVSI